MNKSRFIIADINFNNQFLQHNENKLRRKKIMHLDKLMDVQVIFYSEIRSL